MTTLPVRAAAAADEARLLTLMADFNCAEGIPWRPEAVAPALRRLLAEPELGTVLLAGPPDAPCGYAVLTWGYDLEFAGRDGWLTEIYLHPEAREQGHGRALLAVAEAAARAAGVRSLHLAVRPDNAVALGLYRRAGFNPVERLWFSKHLEPPPEPPGKVHHERPKDTKGWARGNNTK